jgi:hypothetical protein
MSRSATPSRALRFETLEYRVHSAVERVAATQAELLNPFRTAMQSYTTSDPDDTSSPSYVPPEDQQQP